MNFIPVHKTLLLVFLVFLFGCITPISEPLKLGTNLWIGYEPFYLARNLGYFTPNEVSLYEMPSNSDVIRAFENGLIDCAALTLDETFLLLQDSIDEKILIILDVSNGADALLVQPGIKSFKELKGKRIGVENTAVGAYLLSRALESNHLEPKDIQIIPKIEANHEQALKTGEVEGVVTFEPIRTKLIAWGANVLFDSRQIPNEIFDVLVVKTNILQNRPGDIEKLKKAWFKTLNYLNTNKKQANVFISKRLDLTPAEFENSLSGIRFPGQEENRKILSGNFLQSAEKVKEIMFHEKLLIRSIDPSLLIIMP